MKVWIHPSWLRHDLRDLGCVVAIASILANFMPDIGRMDMFFARWPKARPALHDGYVWLVDMVAFIALNWRVCLPSMDFQFFGFARKAKHAVRNWRQDHADAHYEE